MKLILIHSKLALTILVLALGGLAFAAGTPAAHADQPPFIDAYGQGGGAQVYGWHFTAGELVRLEILDATQLHVESVKYVKAWTNSSISYGVFDALMNTSYTGKAYVEAFQLHCIRFWTGAVACRYLLASKVQTYIYPAPHIEVTNSSGLQVRGSGFTPGTTVRVEVLSTSLNVRSTEYVTADDYGIDAGTFFTIVGAPCGTSYIAADGAPGPTAWAKINISC